jgi:sporadic carbohydrate cluster 2OG-Fe(II) oxygenase
MDMKQCFDPNFDNNQVSYDLSTFNLPQWGLEKVRELYPSVSALDNLHKELTTEQIINASAHAQKACKSQEFVNLLDSIIESTVLPLVNKPVMVQRFGTMRIVVPDQAKKGRLLGYHTGIVNGNGWGLRTMWIPFTSAFDSNTMQILPWDKSQSITRRVMAEQWDFETLQSECHKDSFPVNLEPGDMHLFTQGHWHGNVNNSTNRTRVSMDLRLLFEGEQYHRKLPGGYFRFLGDLPEQQDTGDYSGKTFVTYAGWNSHLTTHLPLPLQRHAINEYCRGKGIVWSDYQYELEFMDWLPNLQYFIEDKSIDGVVLYSIVLSLKL